MSYVDLNLSTSSIPAMSLASPSTTSPSAARRLRTKTSDFTDFLRRSHSHRESHPPPLPAGTAELAKEPDARSKRRIPLFGLKRKSAGTIKDASASASESESTTKTKDWRKLTRLSAGQLSAHVKLPQAATPTRSPFFINDTFTEFFASPAECAYTLVFANISIHQITHIVSFCTSIKWRRPLHDPDTLLCSAEVIDHFAPP
ncbi:hypothetical protein EWM64_g7437 [Hericium alpestre]|uniref:Uncharacterized protein n=1 Tax=Hericium alpestre TaxID=135208 RepID=A0A4Y9ZPR4_9AGAM|nr:hypothetical protein EWM64_g7437 [Hericium alpestre]